MSSQIHRRDNTIHFIDKFVEEIAPFSNQTINNTLIVELAALPNNREIMLKSNKTPPQLRND